MVTKILKEKNLHEFIEKLSGEYDVIVPVKDGEQVVFKKYEKGDEVVLEYGTTMLPPKKFLLPQYETMMKYGKDGIKPVKATERKLAFLGLHSCDIHAFSLLDLVEKDEMPDPYYSARRDGMLIVGITCTMPTEFCFCESMGTDKTKDFDLWLTPVANGFLIETGSKTGEALIEKNRMLMLDALPPKKKSLKLAKKVNIKNLEKILKEKMGDKIWEELGNKCLSCGACTFVCPTCYCYSVVDNTDLTLKNGERVRYWDSCQLIDFARCAGGHNFRGTRAARMIQRMYHKMCYFTEKYKISLCVGCGRCIKHCVADIDIAEAMNKVQITQVKEVN